jgi:hypothetical protein
VATNIPWSVWADEPYEVVLTVLEVLNAQTEEHNREQRRAQARQTARAYR